MSIHTHTYGEWSRSGLDSWDHAVDVAREAIDREGFTSARDLDVRIQMVHPALSPATWSVDIRADFGRSVKAGE